MCTSLGGLPKIESLKNLVNGMQWYAMKLTNTKPKIESGTFLIGPRLAAIFTRSSNLPSLPR